MRVTKKLLCQRVDHLNEAGANISIISTCGHYSIERNDKRQLFSGSASDCFAFLAGVFAVYFQDVKFT